MNVQGTWTLVIQNSSTTGTTGTLNSWSLTFQKPLPTSGLGAAGQRRRHRQLPDLHPEPDRRPVERGLDARRRRLEHRRGRPGQRHRRGSLRPLGQHGLRRRRQRRRLEDHRLPHDQPRRADLDPADQLRPQRRHQHQQHRHLPQERQPQPVDHHRRHRRRHQRPAGHRRPGRRLPDLAPTAASPGTSTTAPTTSPAYTKIAAAATSCRSTPRPAIASSSAPRPTRSPSTPAHPQRPGDHLRRPERHQRRHLAEREHGPDLDAGARRQRDRRRPRPEQRHRPRPGHRHRRPGQPPDRLRRHRRARAST